MAGLVKPSSGVWSGIGAVVVVALRPDRPAVIVAALHVVQLVAASRPMLQIPQPAGAVELQAEQVAMAPAPDLVAGRAPVRQRIARRCRAVEIEANDRAQRVRGVLRRILLLPIAAGNEQVFAVGAEGDAVRIVSASGHLGGLAPDHVEILHRAIGTRFAHQLTATDHRAARVAIARLGPAEVDRAGAERIRALAVEEGDIAKPALAAVIDRRRACDFPPLAGLGIISFQRPGLLGDHHDGRAGDEGGGPRLVEAAQIAHREGADGLARLAGFGAGGGRCRHVLPRAGIAAA